MLFDKGRRPGGRLTSLQLDDRAWDLGAPFVRATRPDFATQIAAWERSGLVSSWPTGPEGAYVGTPVMGSLIEAQCADHDVRFGTLVQRVARRDDGWHVHGAGFDLGPFTALVIAVPAEQATALLSLHDFAMAGEAAAARSQARWAAMIAFDQPLAGLPDFVQDCGDLDWAARNTSKPGRGPAECWVVHAGTGWSARNLEREPAAVAPDLLRLLAQYAGRVLPEPTFLKAHRWRFACAFGQRGAALWNAQLRLGACGDWCIASGIEGAWRSGTDLAQRLATGSLAALSPTADPRQTPALSKTGTA